MAHFAKFAKGAVGHMAKHYDRSAKEKIGNENVDLTRSHLNYNLATHQTLSQIEFIRQRLSEVRVQNRKDVNVLCDWVVTAPKILGEGFEEEFFKDTYAFLEEKYGKENVVSAYVHNDEITPHLHFAFIPVVADERRGGHKVSAKECVTKNDLKSFHQQLSKHLEKSFGCDVGVLNGATESGNKTILELKAKTLEDNLSKASSELSEAQERILNADGELDLYRQQKERLEANIGILEDKAKLEESKIQKLSSIPYSVSELTQVLYEKTKGFGKNKKIVEVTLDKETYDKLIKATYYQLQNDYGKYKLYEENNHLKRDNEQMKTDLTVQGFYEIKQENEKLAIDNARLKNANNNLISDLHKEKKEQEKIYDALRKSISSLSQGEQETILMKFLAEKNLSKNQSKKRSYDIEF